MAAHPFVFNSGEVMTGTSLKTVAHVRAASNHGILVTYIKVSFKGTSATAAPILVEIANQDSDGTATTTNPTERDPNHPDTLQATGRTNFTSAPTSNLVLQSSLCHPQGFVEFVYPFVADGGKAIGVRVTAGADVACVVSMRGEE